MKNYLLITAFALITFSAAAQQKGTHMLGVGFNNYTYNTGDEAGVIKNKQVALNFGYAYFIKENTRLGLDFGFNQNKYRDANNNYPWNNKGNSFKFSYTTYHPLVKKFYYNLSESVSFASEKNVYNSNPTEIKRYSVGVSAGLAYFISKHFMFEAEALSLSYTTGTEKTNTYNIKTSSIQFQNMFNPAYLGFKVNVLF